MPGGQSNLGYLYETGQGGLQQNYAEAEKWYRLAAEQGDVSGQYNLGLLYLRGNGVQKNYLKAEKWLRKAAEQDFAEAQHDLGVLYSVGGSGLQIDLVEAYKWILIASTNKVVRVEISLSLLKSQMSQKQIAKGELLAEEWLSQH